MTRRRAGALLVTLVCLAVSAPPLAAEEPKYELKSPAATLQDVLLENHGKRVIVHLESGEAIEGTVTTVGDIVVHLAKVAGRDFYDAVVRMDRISAVVFKVRSK